MYYAARLKQENDCNGCRICITSCPEGNAIRLLVDADGVKKVEVVARRCKGCELCVELCPRESLETVLR